MYYKSRFDFSWPDKPKTEEKRTPTKPTEWPIGWTVDEVNRSLERERAKGRLIPPSKK